MISWGMLSPQKEHHSQIFPEVILDQMHQDFFYNTCPSASEPPPSLLCPDPIPQMLLPSVTLVPPHVGIRQHESLNPIVALHGLGHVARPLWIYLMVGKTIQGLMSCWKVLSHKSGLKTHCRGKQQEYVHHKPTVGYHNPHRADTLIK